MSMTEAPVRPGEAMYPQEYEPGEIGPQRPNGDVPEATEKVPCDQCGTLRGAGNVSGLCKTCWHRSEWPRRNAMANHGQGQARKTDVTRMAREFLAPALRALYRYAAEEDAGIGLAAGLEIQDLVAVLTDELGVTVFDRYAAEPPHEAAARIGAELLDATGQPKWADRSRPWKRWGPESAARGRIARRQS